MPETAKRPWRTGAKSSPITITKPDGTVQTITNLNDKKRRGEREAWRAKRKRVLERDGHACIQCGRRQDDKDMRFKREIRTVLEVHHRTYERYGHEWLEDLVTLCQRCHSAAHQWRRRERRARA